MGSELEALFRDLAEKERIKGHHSAEGRAIRTLSRALNGWTAGNLGGRDVLVLCDQAVEDWLKAKLNLSGWSTPALDELTSAAVDRDWMTPADAVHLQSIRDARDGPVKDSETVSIEMIEESLQFCIRLVEKHW